MESVKNSKSYGEMGDEESIQGAHIIQHLTQIENILQAEAKRRSESNALLSEYINNYFDDINNNLDNSMNKKM